MLWAHGKCHGTRKCKTSGSYCIHVVSVLYGPRLSQVGVADRSVTNNLTSTSMSKELTMKAKDIDIKLDNDTNETIPEVRG